MNPEKKKTLQNIIDSIDDYTRCYFNIVLKKGNQVQMFLIIDKAEMDMFAIGRINASSIERHFFKKHIKMPDVEL